MKKKLHTRRSLRPVLLILLSSFLASITLISTLWLQTMFSPSYEHMHASSRPGPKADSVDSDPWPEESFCVGWSSQDSANRTLQPVDEWLARRPTMDVVNETSDRFCVGPATHPYVHEFLRIHANQYHRPCDEVALRPMWSSGWSADMANVCTGLYRAVHQVNPYSGNLTSVFGLPLVMKTPWHYSANKDDQSNPTCHQADLTCYVVPYHSCGSYEHIMNTSKIIEDESFDEMHASQIDTHFGRAAHSYIMRKQLWLRRSIFEFIRSFKEAKGDLGSNCTVIHVRRSDVVLHTASSRQYIPLAEYVKKLPKERLEEPIFLLTDDSGAIDEAHEFFPDLAWKYFDRPRHNGSSGGWENQTPSRDPAYETITLLSTFELAKQCTAMVYGHSGFATHILAGMRENGRKIDEYRADNVSDVMNENHTKSEEELRAKLEFMRLHGVDYESSEPANSENEKTNDTAADTSILP